MAFNNPTCTYSDFDDETQESLSFLSYFISLSAPAVYEVGSFETL